MNLPKSRHAHEYIYLSLPETLRDAPNYLLEKVDGIVHIHRQLSCGEFMWYNEKKVFLHNQRLYVRSIKTVDCIAAGIKYITNLWEVTVCAVKR